MSDTTIPAIALGLLEGLTEFLPVSSTGHLIVGSEAFDALHARGWAVEAPGSVYEIVIQLGAILAICVVYFSRLWGVLVRLPSDPGARRFVLALVLTTIPAGVLGYLLHDFIKRVLFSPWVVAVALIVGGFVILAIERREPPVRVTEIERMGWATALLIGFAQCLAMIPGVSRSAATILGAVSLGVERRTAAIYSFFAAIPVMIGASALDLKKSWGTITPDQVSAIGIGFVVAFLAALVIVKPFVNFVGRNGFAPFAYYRIAFGVVVIVAQFL